MLSGYLSSCGYMYTLNKHGESKWTYIYILFKKVGDIYKNELLIGKF